jgi:rhamnose utilization protein RhaD (predicted bifunctional aldolase and dehydrogenase)
MSDKSAPNPSVEAILHAIIPYKYVDHTHADAIVTLTNSKAGLDTIKRLYKNYLIVPYVMPGFILAKEVYKLSKSIKWEDIKGIILLKHGIFTFANSAKESYDNMIQAVTKAELEINKPPFDLDKLQDYMSQKRGFKVSMNINTSYSAKAFSTLKEPHRFGILTPEHIIRTKRYPVLLEKDFKNEIDEYISEYISYFNRHKSNEIMLNPAPNWAVVRDYGIITFGKDNKECNIIEDIAMHTIEAIFNAQKYGGFDSLNESECFKMEYWELEQAKLKAK